MMLIFRVCLFTCLFVLPSFGCSSCYPALPVAAGDCGAARRKKPYVEDLSFWGGRGKTVNRNCFSDINRKGAS